MGYSYGMNPSTGRFTRLACDSCGEANGKTRKRTCPHRVHYAEGGSLPYCYPSALCQTCYAKNKTTLHATCKAGADAQTAKEVARAARLAAGELEVRAAWGDWHANVPTGLVGVVFSSKPRIVWPGAPETGREEYRLVTDYEPGTRHWLSDYPDAQPWAGPEGTTH